MPQDDDTRYQEIMRRIEQRKREAQSTPVFDELARILDNLNAFAALEDVRKVAPSEITAFGVKPVRGYMPSPWVSVLLWYKPSGYYFYERLSLIGVWAVREGDTVSIIIGTKTLPYGHEVYNAESYYHQMQRGFEVYYPGDCSPPDEALYRTEYKLLERLKLRAEISDVLKEVMNKDQ